MTNFVMQVLKDIDVDGGTLHEWTNINRGDKQFQRTWTKIDAGLPVRVLHKAKTKAGVFGRPFKVVKNVEALPDGFEASGFEVAA
jgi:hypothetical protein|tara:strand:- start:307 stop:561 length:255 start_codon:yes stop_codon:yes gene_type:complete